MVNICQCQHHAGTIVFIAVCVELTSSISSVALLLRKLRQQTIISPLYLTLTFPLIKTSVHQDLTTRIAFDKLVVKGEQAAITESLNLLEAPSVSSHAVMWRWHRQIQMTPHQQLAALKLAILLLAAWLE